MYIYIIINIYIYRGVSWFVWKYRSQKSIDQYHQIIPIKMKKTGGWFPYFQTKPDFL